MDPLVSALVMVSVVLLLWAMLPSKDDKRRETFEQEDWEKEFYLTPRFEDVERHVGWKVPKAIRHLYENQTLVLAKDFYFLDPDDPAAAWHVARFWPARLFMIEEVWPTYPDAFFFAMTLCHDAYFVPARQQFDDPLPVFLLHRNGEVTKVTNSVRDFLAWQRVPASTYHWGEEKRFSRN